MKKWMRLFAMLLVLASATAPAVQTEVFIDDAVADFAQGDITTSTLTYRGTVLPPMLRSKVGETNASVVWDVARVNGSIYAATGHEAKLFRLGADGRSELAHEFDETALFSIVPGREGGLLVAASPGGVIYKQPESGEPTVFARTGTDIVWDMAWRGDELLVATGSNAGVFAVADDGTTTTIAMMPFALNVLDLAVEESTGDIIAATQGPGHVVRITADGAVRVLLDPEQEEVRRVAILPDGTVVGAVNGERSPGEKLLELVTDAARKQGNQKPRPESFLVRIEPDGLAREWWTAPESPIHDIAVHADGALIVSAGSNGNLYMVFPNGDANHVGVAVEKHITRLAMEEDGRILAGTGAEAAVYEIDPAATADGIYESRVFDGRGTVTWGRLRAMLATGDGAVRISTRAGNTKEPGDTWADWTEARDFNSGEFLVESAISRFFQYRLELVTSDSLRAVPPEIDLVRVFYTRPNVAPRVTNVQLGPPKDKAPTPPPLVPTGRVIAFPFSNPELLEVTWMQEDANGDILRAALYLQSLGSEDWTLVEDEIAEPKYALPTRGIPDGEYRARVVASDHLVNDAAAALKGEAESPLFLIDNTAPEVVVLSVLRESDEKVSVRFRAEDGASLVTGAAWRAGFADWIVLTADDGVVDQSSESFTFTVSGPDAKRGRFVTLVASDEKGNAVLQKVILE